MLDLFSLSPRRCRLVAVVYSLSFSRRRLVDYLGRMLHRMPTPVPGIELRLDVVPQL